MLHAHEIDELLKLNVQKYSWSTSVERNPAQ
jgi:hypothetical protein